MNLAPLAVVALASLALMPSDDFPVRRAVIPVQRDTSAATDSLTQVEMRNVDFHVDPEIALRIHYLRGTMRSIPGGPVMFDDRKAYIIHLDTARVGLTGADLSALLNKYVFAYPGAPLKNLRVTISGDQIVQKGTLHKVLDVPFEITASLSLTADDRIRIHPTKTVILGLHVDHLMRALGLSLDKIISLSGAKGATVRGNDIFLDPLTILPPPKIEGRVSDIRVAGSEVLQTFAPGPSGEPRLLRVPDPSQANYMLYLGGRLQFGKLLMLDAEMQIVDLDPQDPLNFSLDDYNKQLVAGYLQALPDGGLEIHFRDLDKLGTAHISVTSVPNP